MADHDKGAPPVWKRIAAAILGLLSLYSALAGSEFARMAFEDFHNPDVPTLEAVLGVMLFLFFVLAALSLGAKFLYFAISGKQSSRRSKSYSVFLGLACAIPGFFFSLPVTLWVFYRRANENGAENLAFLISGLVGAVSAIVGCILLLRQKPS